MSSTIGDRLIVTEDSDDDQEREDFTDSDGSGNEGPSSTDAGNEDETVAFPTLRKKKKVVKKLTKKEQSMKRSLKDYRIRLAMVKPDITTHREKERNLRRIATKGVVQLFNAVSDRQKTMSDAVKEKMTAKERKEARSRFDGKNFDVSKFDEFGYEKTKSELKDEHEGQDEMDIGEEMIDQTNYSDED